MSLSGTDSYLWCVFEYYIIYSQTTKSINFHCHHDRQSFSMQFLQVIPTAELAATAIESVERWGPLARHPHVVAIRETFVSREVEDTASLFFVHDYYPGAITLQAMHLQQEQASGVVHLTVRIFNFTYPSKHMYGLYKRFCWMYALWPTKVVRQCCQ